MPPELPPTSFVLLGLLARRPMAGYDLAAFADRTVAHFWPIQRSQLYRELPRLEELGYVSGERVAQQQAPTKRVYTLTAQGREALQAWLDGPSFQVDRVRNGLLVKVFFARHMAPDRLAALLRDYRAAVEQELADLTAITEQLAHIPRAAYGRATALYGVRHFQATLGWLDEVEPLLTAGRVKERR